MVWMLCIELSKLGHIGCIGWEERIGLVDKRTAESTGIVEIQGKLNMWLVVGEHTEVEFAREW